MLRKRVIPCLDVANGRVMKGVNFVHLVDEGDPVALAARYAAEGADEICYLDITAAPEGRPTLLDLVRRTASDVFVPLTVGGGIRQPEDMKAALRAGADKVSVNTAAVDNPQLLADCARRFGRQCVVVAIDAKRVGNSYRVFVNGGRTATDLDAVEWARTATRLGAGEVLLTSIDRDGTSQGFELELTSQVARAVEVPVIASGGAGAESHFVEAIIEGEAQAVLAASLFHRRIVAIKSVKAAMKAAGLPVREAA